MPPCDPKSVQVIRWNRDCAAPESVIPSGEVICLFYRGFSLNRLELARLADAAPSGSTADLLVSAYRRLGPEVARHVLSPYSFVVWDGVRELLFATTDREGYHPLFLADKGREISVASRVELLADLSLQGLDRTSIAAHVCSFAPPPGATFFRGVRALEPGSSLSAWRERVEIDPPRGRISEPRLRQESKAAGTLRDTLLAVVPEYAPEDAAVGVTVSSGLDSTSVAAALRASRPQAKIVAFVWTSRSVPSADESGPALRVARSLDMEIVEIAADEHGPLSTPEGILPNLGSPLYNSYSPAWRETYRIARERNIGVLLTGHAGDFAFGSVFPFADLFLTGRWLRLAREVRAYRNRVDAYVPWVVRYQILGRSARWFLPITRVNPPPWLGAALREVLPHPPSTYRFALPGDRERRHMLENPRRFAITAAQTAEGREFGIDLRHPWIDSRVVDLARRVPAAWTFKDGYSKALVRRAMRGLLPDEILDRPEKIYPTELFLRALRGPERSKIEPLLSNMLAAELGFVEPNALRKAVEDCARGDWRGAMFWHSLTLEAWLRRLAG
ncbi:MAG: asparagine synthetase B family protein [Acidobacteriota bacterium]